MFLLQLSKGHWFHSRPKKKGRGITQINIRERRREGGGRGLFFNVRLKGGEMLGGVCQGERKKKRKRIGFLALLENVDCVNSRPGGGGESPGANREREEGKSCPYV